MPKKLLITGSNGFLGNSIIPFLEEQYQITSLDLTNADIKCNISRTVADLPFADIVIHAAGKAHVIPNSEEEEKLFFDINFQGTVNLLKALEANLPNSIIFISTVAVYGLEKGEVITEDFPLNGSTPYALSKIQAEEYLTHWCSKNKVTLGILRPALIAGKNPPGNLSTMIDGIKTGKYLRIGNGSAKKSILMAEDIVRVIPKLAEVGGTYNLCDNHHPTIAELDEIIAKQLDKKPMRSIPYWLAKILARIGDLNATDFPINSIKLDKITQSLTFSNEKAKRELDWEPLDVLQNFRIS